MPKSDDNAKGKEGAKSISITAVDDNEDNKDQPCDNPQSAKAKDGRKSSRPRNGKSSKPGVTFADSDKKDMEPTQNGAVADHKPSNGRQLKNRSRSKSNLRRQHKII